MPDPLDRPDPITRENGARWTWPGWLIAYVATLFVLRDIILTLFK